MRVLQSRRGLPLISAPQEPHLAALQFRARCEVGVEVVLDVVDGIEHHHADHTGDLILKPRVARRPVCSRNTLSVIVSPVKPGSPAGRFGSTRPASCKACVAAASNLVTGHAR